MEGILYRTNSYTGNNNPFHSTLDVIDNMSEQEYTTLLSHFLFSHSELDPVITDAKDILVAIRTTKNESVLKDKAAFSERYLKFMESFNKISLTNCCWFAKKDIVLNRRSGYGVNLCKENGVLKCVYKPEDMVVLMNVADRTLVAFPDTIKLMPDVLTNKQLITREQLEALREIEANHQQLLAETPLKYDVLHILKLESRGLLKKKLIPKNTKSDTPDFSDVL